MLRAIDQDLKRVVFGQDQAIEALAAAIKLSRAGLREPEKPIGCYMFSGPTGVGKTEVARQLALLLGVELLRFDMSEYMERHTVSRLIGAPPGYVGFDQGGLLTDGIDQHPHSVLLLDEIEKAHPDLFNILLQIMDHGKLTDHNGKKVDFQNVILIMTTNAGASDLAKAAIGFNRSKREGDDEEAITRLFSPEFRNRLDAIIAFANLPPEVISKVVEKFVFQLEAQLGDRNITIELTPEANAWLAERGYDEKFGARPLARVIQEHIKKPLAEEILFGALKDGGIVRVLVQEKDGQKELGFEYLKADAPIRPRGPDGLEPEDFDTDDSGPEGVAGETEGRRRSPKPKAKRARAGAGPTPARRAAGHGLKLRAEGAARLALIFLAAVDQASSFETRPSAAPQDEALGPHGEERAKPASRTMRSGSRRSELLPDLLRGGGELRLVGHDAGMGLELRALFARDDVDVEVEHGLAGCRAVELLDQHAVGADRLAGSVARASAPRP